MKKFNINLTNTEHTKVMDMYEQCSKITGVPHKKLFLKVIQEYYTHLMFVNIANDLDINGKPK